MPREKSVWCTNVSGASVIMNRHRSTISNYLSEGSIRGFSYGQNTLIPLRDIARVMGTTQGRVINLAEAWELPLWKCKDEDR